MTKTIPSYISYEIHFKKDFVPARSGSMITYVPVEKSIEAFTLYLKQLENKILADNNFTDNYAVCSVKSMVPLKDYIKGRR